MNALLYVLGIHFYGPTNQWSNFWQGFGSDLGEAALLTALYSSYRRHKCEVPRCWRWQHPHPTRAGDKACRKHHPGLPDRVLSAQDLHDRHHSAA